MLTRQSIETIKTRVNIYDVVSSTVSLKRVGRNWRGLSPFSSEKTPSFYVLPDKGIFKCFSTGLAGDVIRFVEQTEHLSFMEAVETLAERYDIPLEYESGRGPTREERSLKKELLEIHEYAADFFHRSLLGNETDAREVRDYWEQQRHFSMDVAEDFKIGYAPVNSRKLNELLLKKGFRIEAMRESGLFYARPEETNAAGFRNRFQGRLMIPIRDAQGQVIAFTARQLPQTPDSDPAREAKYINSPETPLFYKSRLLFNLDRARNHVDDDTPFLIVEGQLDAIRCWSCGILNAVAPQGTAVTEDQMRLLRRYTNRAHVVLDGDSAGRKAALRVLPLALAAELEIAFLALPDGADPDSLLAEHGASALQRLASEARPAMAFAAQALLPQDTDPSPRERADAVRQLFEIVSHAESEVARSAYLEQAVGCFGTDRQATFADFHRFLSARQRRPQPASSSTTAKPNGEPAPISKLTTAERELFWIVLQDDVWAERLAEVIDHEWIDNSTNEGKLLGRILAEANEGTWEGLKQMDSLLETDEERNFFYSAYAEEHAFDDPLKVANQCVKALWSRYCEGQLAALMNRFSEAGEDVEAQSAVMEQMRDLRRLRMSPDYPPGIAF